MAYAIHVNGKLYELESPGHICFGFCLFDGSYPAYDRQPEGLSIPYGEIRARSPRPKADLQKDLGNEEKYIQEVKHQLSHIKEAIDNMSDAQWEGCRNKLVGLVGLLDRISGIGLSLATKILHPHFPHLLPIVDELCIQQQHGYRGSMTTILDSIRRDMRYSQSAIDEAVCFLSERLNGPHLTRVRVFDVFLWSIMNADNKHIKGVYTKQ